MTLMEFVKLAAVYLTKDELTQLKYLIKKIKIRKTKN